ncbi:MAG: DUF2339 domain-containing protein [Chloroflexota bacterium]
MSRKQLCPTCNHENDANTHICRQCHTNLDHEARLGDLARRVVQLEKTLFGQQLSTAPQSATTAPLLPSSPPMSSTPPAPKPATPQPNQPSAAPKPNNRNTFDDLFSGEFWFNKIGIALVLLALALLFKLAIDRGLITPPIRVGMGLTMATILLGVGIWLNAQRPKLATVLMGGALVSYYLTGFAAYQMYALIPHPIALAFMVCVTIGAFGLAMRQDDGMLAVIGALGGLATPFLLPTDDSNVVGLMGYTCLLLTGTIALYVHRGWSIILWISVVGGWLIAALSIFLQFDIPLFDTWVIQAGIVYMAMLFWIVPVVRTILHSHNPTRWRNTTLGLFDNQQGFAAIRNYDICTLTLVTPFVSLFLSTILWPLVGQQAWGWITLGLAGIFGGVFWLVRHQPIPDSIKQTHLITATLLVTAALPLLFHGLALTGALLLEVLILHWAATRWTQRWTTFIGHALALVVGLRLVPHLLTQTGTPILNSEALIELGMMGIFLLVLRWLRTTEERFVYFVSLHIAFLGWIFSELHGVANGQAVVSAVWGGYASALFVWGMWYRNDVVRYTALITLLGVVAKLFLIDFAYVDALWRIALFFGFGVFFLLLSYAYPSLWRLSSKQPAKQGSP